MDGKQNGDTANLPVTSERKPIDTSVRFKCAAISERNRKLKKNKRIKQ